jgi:hypothetical protein
MHLRGRWNYLTTCTLATFSRKWHICVTLETKFVSSVVFSLLELCFYGRAALKGRWLHAELLMTRMDTQTVRYLFDHIHEEEATADEKFCKRETGIVGDDAGATAFHNL